MEDIPESWLIERVVAKYDLDNIRFEDIKGIFKYVKSVYELTHLLLTGQCTESYNGAYYYPEGLELNLGLPNSINNHHLQDTLVMSNNGYFQLKINPGFWRLSIPKGMTQRLYQFEDVDDQFIFLDNIQGKDIEINFIRKIGKKINLLEERIKERKEEHDRKKNKNKEVQEQGQEQDEERVNIFIIVSGHLYERLSKIMMLSVVKNSNTKVKFWLLKNYLSPKFKFILPHMAKEYGFEYELITYKWPVWLQHQTEKNRIMWGFKILFLDVIFPNDVDRIIYLDADQVIRADMKELMDMDLDNHAVAMTPFCDSRKEVEGFRFWKTGYWKDHLQGKPYHISALFVIDLHKFREMGAGELYRKIYESLSQDPDSLSNLDQDLPNFAQHQIPMYPLHYDWLWCDTWCSDESLETAKTIDLCNNPMTKQPKLEVAKKKIPEWSILNKEGEDFANKIIEQFKKSNEFNQNEEKDQLINQNNRIANEADADENVYQMEENEMFGNYYVFD